MSATAPDADRDLLRLAEQWARATADLALYPPTNMRIRRELDAVVSDLRAATSRLGRIAVRFQDDEVRVARSIAPVGPGSRLPWMRDRLRLLGACGVAIDEGVDADELVTFGQWLAEIRPAARSPQSAALGDQALHAARSAHLELLPLRFAHGLDDGGDTEWSDLGDMRTGDVDRDTFLAAICDAAPDIVEKIRQIQALLGLQAVGNLFGSHDVESTSFDVIGAIHGALPVEAVGDVDRCVEIVRHTLRHARVALESSDTDVSNVAELARIARDAFRRIDRPEPDAPPAEAPSPSAAGPRPDPRIEDLVAAFEALPTSAAPTLRTEALDQTAEQCNALIHTLVRLDDAAARRAVHRHYAALIERERAPALEVLRDWLTHANARNDRVAVARVAGLTAVLGGPRALAGRISVLPAHVAVAFPELLSTYLAEHPVRHLLHPEQLPRLVEELGADTIRGAAEHFGPLPDELTDKLLDIPAACMLPLWHVLLRREPTRFETRVARALGRLQDQVRDADLLHLLVATDTPIPVDLLLEVTSLAPGQEPSRTFRDALADTLAELLQTTRRDRTQLGRRRAALTLAHRYPAARVRAAVKEIAGDRSLLGIGGEDESIREAARAALNRMERTRSRASDV